MPDLPPPKLARRLVAEGIGSFFLFACVIGSGIMAERLSQGNLAIALLGNTLATGAILFVLITMLGPISGAHMNPAVSLVAASRGELGWRDAATGDGRALYHRCLLVHLVDKLRQSGDHDRPQPVQHFCRDSAARRALVHRGAAAWRGGGRARRWAAVRPRLEG